MSDAKRRFLVNVWRESRLRHLKHGVVSAVVGFLVHRLGTGAYGMFSLANTLTMFPAIISSSLTVSITRFLVIDVNKGDYEAANKTFNTALALAIVATGALLILTAIVSFFLPQLFNCTSRAGTRDAISVFERRVYDADVYGRRQLQRCDLNHSSV